jgi:hypothetical protein
VRGKRHSGKPQNIVAGAESQHRPFYSPSPEYPAARRRHSGFGASATCWRKLHLFLFALVFLMNSVLANLFTMSCQAEHYGMACVIGLPIPIMKQKAMMQDFLGPVGGYDRCIEELNLLVEALVTRAEDNGVPCIDFYDLFLSATGHVISEYFLEDGLHANEKGHRRMAKRAVRMLRSRFDLS